MVVLINVIKKRKSMCVSDNKNVICQKHFSKKSWKYRKINFETTEFLMLLKCLQDSHRRTVGKLVKFDHTVFVIILDIFLYDIL